MTKNPTESTESEDTGKAKTDSLIQKIEKKRDAIKQDEKKANLLLDILKLSQSKNTDIVCSSCEALGDVFAHFLANHEFLDTSQVTGAEGEASEEDQFSSWLKEQFETTCQLLCELLGHETEKIQVTALESLAVIVEAGKPSSPSVWENLTKDVMSQLVSATRDQSAPLEKLPSMLGAREDNTAIVTACLNHIKQTLKRETQASDILLLNSWQGIKSIATQDLDEKLKRSMTGLVCDFLKQKIPPSLYKDILTALSSIMEKMSSPIRLADFLSESFNIGGAVSLLSLHGLFILMHKYNLDYPDFYNKLYSMFEPQVFSARYRARFFHLAELFLSSTHLPAYLVAAFAKRLSRLSLHASVEGSTIAIPFVLNLLHHHPECQVLLHRAGAVTDVDTDPYLPKEPDTAKCKALESCLWELQTLESHYSPSLSLQAKKRHIAERDLASVLENSTGDVIASEAKKVKSDVAVTFVKPSDLELPDFFVL